MEFICPPNIISEIRDGLIYDVDLVRHAVYKVENLPEVDCTLEEECVPPVYRYSDMIW